MRLHWHGGRTTLLAGDYRAGYWRGPAGCPPECPGLKPPYSECLYNDVDPGLPPGHYVVEFRAGLELLAYGKFDITP